MSPPITGRRPLPKRAKGKRGAGEVADFDFEPWDDTGWRPPLSDKDWLDFGQTPLIMLRTAWRILHRTKAQLMEIDAETALQTSEHLEESWRALDALGDMLKSADARILCAASAAVAKTGRAS
jgi:hypothetical protein